jgi:hypothetical protein
MRLASGLTAMPYIPPAGPDGLGVIVVKAVLETDSGHAAAFRH